jgi:ribose transport system ATP-binding protein
MTTSTNHALWELRAISKHFPGVRALSGVTLSLHRGRIHALLGQNGSGKTTLARCLAGVHPPDDGELVHAGDVVHLRSPSAAAERGVAIFHQEFSLVPPLSVAENICLGRMPGPRGVVDWEAARRQARDALGRLGVSLDVTRPVSTLSVAEQQLVEIAKALSGEKTLLILDEPAAALGPLETQRLHDVIRALRSEGTAILYISHRLDDVFDVADDISVLRDGRLVRTIEAVETNLREVIRMMIGSDIEKHFEHHPSGARDERLRVDEVWTDAGVNGASFTVARGEVLGLGGVIGSGRTEIARALFGADRITRGTLWIDGRELRPRSPRDAIAEGIALIPEDRKADALFFNFPAPANITVANLDAVSSGPFLSLASERDQARRLIGELEIDPRAVELTVRLLSGGNQQKVILARWLFSDAKVLILDEPTQGIDVSSKADVYRLVDELTARGVAVVLISSDYRELLEISDRIAVVQGGRVNHIASHGELTEHELIEMAAVEIASEAS